MTKCAAFSVVSTNSGAVCFDVGVLSGTSSWSGDTDHLCVADDGEGYIVSQKFYWRGLRLDDIQHVTMIPLMRARLVWHLFPGTLD